MLAFAHSRGIDAGDARDLPEAWAALRRAGETAPGLAFAAWSATGDLTGPVLPILANSPDVGAVLARLARFHPLVASAEVVVERQGQRTFVSLRDPSGRPVDDDTVDATFTLLTRALDQLTGGKGRPDRVRLRRRPPADPAPYAAALGDVRFGSARDACEFEPATLGAPIVHADPVVLSVLEPYAESLVAQLAQPWNERVARVLRHRLGEEAVIPTLTEVARALATSPRTLQAKLRDEDTSFRELCGTIQRERALGLLRSTDLPIATIAAHSGFDSPAAFTRAVRRWTGRSPTDLRDPISGGAGTA